MRGSDLWKKAWPELIALFFVGVVLNPLTYLLLATVTGDPQIGGYVFYYFLMLSLLTMGLPMFLWGGALFFCADPSEPKVPSAEMEGHASRVVLVLSGVRPSAQER